MNTTRLKTTIAITVVLMAGGLTACQSTPSTKDPEKAVQVRTQLAAEYIRTRDLDSAKRSLDQALKLNSRDANANMMMGILLQQEGSKLNMEKADAYFKRAISSEPDNAQARNNYGTYLYQMQRYNEAIEQFTRAGATLGYDQRFQSLENLGRIYLLLGDVTNAEKSFKQALQANRNATISMLELSEIFYLQQNNRDASQLYEQYVRSVGQRNQGARALWIGIRIARANADQLGMQVLVNQLRALFPDSPEYQRYLQLQYSTEAVWK
ncbi:MULTISPECIES: type IV pilus biogenesis/stability protein PilW [Acinetobacter]|uniref:Type IV pilus biogenesis/stability protein PilW n=4 Tax=Acinetobacter TaxID=469 RepID=A0AAW4JFL0_ACIHA|nr:MULTISPECIES: type IV pilus biogenesis/stability protein PilW [Acinetobacter]APR69418.1 type IV pilus biogenesis/stability protein PilW [Acinetobacter haemolyticus]ATZ68158.1 type IV pilus biogenesis/stability protein PilW [Acinetobacter haemolyticus]MBO3658736.1 type IV pilus biogenesis/stability protein PilW [Acinetobacter haemolyticus]MCU4377845.1 type IV pilus biogenesis/stability protein PilW [Acinetobacter haemolyticus]MCU4387479.1 type IV pilus biogenesis/stability protein PilW [Acin